MAQILQTFGLAHTDASVSGFVTGTYVVLTPVFTALLLRERVPASTWYAVLLAPAGLALLSLNGFAVGLGEGLTLGAAAAIRSRMTSHSPAKTSGGLSLIHI